MPRRSKPEDWEEWKRLKRKGKSFAEISRLTGWSSTTIFERVHGRPCKRSPGKLDLYKRRRIAREESLVTGEPFLVCAARYDALLPSERMAPTHGVPAIPKPAAFSSHRPKETA